MEKQTISYQAFYELILTYIESHQPPVKESMHFVGTLIYSIIDIIDMSEYEKEFYVDIYNKLIIKRLKEKEFKEELVIG